MLLFYSYATLKLKFLYMCSHQYVILLIQMLATQNLVHIHIATRLLRYRWWGTCKIIDKNMPMYPKTQETCLKGYKNLQRMYIHLCVHSSASWLYPQNIQGTIFLQVSIWKHLHQVLENCCWTLDTRPAYKQYFY